MRVAFLAICFLLPLAGGASLDDYQYGDEAQCANAPGLWDNFFTNLDRMFWRPWLDKYRVVRYATPETSHRIPPQRWSWEEGPWLNRTCSQLGLTGFWPVLLMHETAWAWAPPAWVVDALVGSEGPVPAALRAIQACPRTAWAANTTLMTSLNTTLQRQGRCAYATKAMRCAFGNLYWIFSYGVLLLLILGVSAVFVFFGTFLCCCWCWGTLNGEDYDQEPSLTPSEQ